MEDDEGHPLLTRDVLATMITGLRYRDPDDDTIRPAADRFWLEAVGSDQLDDVEDQAFLYGFVEGALEVWEAVKDEL
jgi:hypothetical protein